MAGSYRQLKNGKWELTVHIGYDMVGKRIRKYKIVDASGPREAEKLLALFVSEQGRIDVHDKDRVKLSEFIDYWFERYAEKNMKEKSINWFLGCKPRLIKYLGNKKLKDIRPTHLLDFYDLLQQDGSRLDGKPGGLHTTNIKHHHTALSMIFSQAVQWQYITENPCERVKPPQPTKAELAAKKERENNMYTIDQVQQLIDAVDDLTADELKYRVMIWLAIFTGFRREEIMGLRWRDINFANKSITTMRSMQYTKRKGTFEGELKTNGAERTSIVPDDMIALLREYKLWWNGIRVACGQKWHNTDNLFIQWSGKPMHVDTISSWFPKFIQRINKKILADPEMTAEQKQKLQLPHLNFHGLRHLHISILVESGLDFGTIADDAGHASTQMIIQKYRHKVKEKSAEVSIKMENALLKNREKQAK